MQQKNFLHDNPQWYEKALPEPENKALSRFAEDVIEKYSEGKRVLDVGCGLGREIEYLRKRGYTADGIDASPKMVFEAKKRCPEARIELGSMREFDLKSTYETLLCFGSTFLYNHSNEEIMATLKAFRKHLSPAGVLAMEMRNAAYFLTPEGQSTLGSDRHSSTPTSEGYMKCTSRFEIDTARQLLNRSYTWFLPQGGVREEFLQHRLIFPQEMRTYLEISGYETVLMFDSPVPAAGEAFDPEAGVSEDLSGYRLHVIAKKI